MAPPNANTSAAAGAARPDEETRINILLVDDEVRNLDALESVLQSPGYNLVRVLTAEGALTMLLELEFAVIVLDVQLREMSGIELAKVIKQRKRSQRIPIIFLTAYYQEEKEVLNGYGSGAVDFLTKPINPQILKSKIDVIADLYRKTRALGATNAVIELEIAQRKKAEEALRLANSELESRVNRRTSELLGANDELRKRESALRDSQAQLQFVTDHAPVFLVQCDREHRLKFVNRAFAEKFGFEANQLTGMHFSEAVGDEAYAAFRHHFDDTLEGRRVEFETEITHPNYGARWMHAVQEPERNQEGEVVGLLAVISDITERKLVEREVARTRDKAMAASRAKDHFLARLSHELRMPLNPVLLLASDAAKNTQLPEEVRADFEMIAESVKMEARLIDDLLDISRIASGKLALEVRPFDVHVILQEALETVQAEASQKHLVVSLDLKADRHVVLCDDIRLKQVFWNLLKNSVKFTPEGGRITVETRRIPEAENLSIRIIDTGIGMTPEEIGRVFEAFSQGDHADDAAFKHFGGLGLGLAISRMLVEQHSGAIQAMSDGRNLGSTLLVELPLYQADDQDAGRQAPRELAGGVPFLPQAQTPGNERRVLLAEDDKATRSALARLLARRQFKVVSAGSVSEARAAAERESFDLLVSDIELPDGSGCDLMVELRGRHGLVGIALTGHGMEEDVNRSQAAGFSGHLTKPVSAQGLDCALASAFHVPPAVNAA